MKKKWIVTAVIALSLLGSNFAYAQPGPGSHRGSGHPSVVHRQHDHRPRAYQPPRQTRPPHQYSHYKLSQHRHTPHGDLRPGYAIPKYYDKRQHYVADWRRHNLYPPARGYRWVSVDNNFLLVAITSGIITHILMGH